MLKIKSYLQYRKTPNNKPRVLREVVDYNTIYNNDLYLSEGEIIGRYIAAIEYCRPLLTVEIANYRWNRIISDKTLNLREMQIVHYLGKKAKSEDDYDREECWGISVFRDGEMCVFFPHPQVTWAIFSKHIHNKKGNILEYTGITASTLNHDDMLERIEIFNFESDPKKYSKLLWNCSESEGWEKILNLLNQNQSQISYV